MIHNRGRKSKLFLPRDALFTVFSGQTPPHKPQTGFSPLRDNLLFPFTESEKTSILNKIDRIAMRRVERKGGFCMDDFTRKFNLVEERDAQIHAILSTVYQALEEKGYNPINQIVGYILSEDPTYITNHNHARTLIRKIDRDELLQVLVRKYLGQ